MQDLQDKNSLRNSIFLAKKGVFSKNSSKEISKKKFLIIFFMFGRLVLREIHCFHASSIFINMIFLFDTTKKAFIINNLHIFLHFPGGLNSKELIDLTYDWIFKKICVIHFYFDILKWPTCWKGRHSYQKNVDTNFSVFWHFWETFVTFCFNSTKNEKLFLINGIENQQICNFHRFRKSYQNNWILLEISSNHQKI